MTDEDRGTTEVSGCATCSGHAYGGDDQCPKCQQEGRDPGGRNPAMTRTKVWDGIVVAGDEGRILLDDEPRSTARVRGTGAPCTASGATDRRQRRPREN